MHSTSHSDDADAKTLARLDSGGPTAGLKESKLKQPEARPKILDKVRTLVSSPAPKITTTASSTLTAPVAGSKGGADPSDTQQAKRAPPPPDKNSSKANRSFARAESKESGTSLHKVGSVQSLANEIRRIRSLRNDPESKPAEEKSKKPEKKVR